MNTPNTLATQLEDTDFQATPENIDEVDEVQDTRRPQPSGCVLVSTNLGSCVLTSKDSIDELGWHTTNYDHVPGFDDSDDEGAPDGSSIQDYEEVEYTTEVPGRSLGEQPIPRYDLSKLRPFEIMFADNKDYPVTVRGDKQTAFVLICYKSQAKFKMDLSSPGLTTAGLSNAYVQ